MWRAEVNLQWTVESLVPYLLFTLLFKMGWPEALVRTLAGNLSFRQ